MTFEDQMVECDHCGDVVCASERSYVFIWRKETYCSTDCLIDKWTEEFGDEIEEVDGKLVWRGEEFDDMGQLGEYWEEYFDKEIELKHLWTAEDYEWEWADRKYDEWRDNHMWEGTA